MFKMRLGWYAGVSTALAGTVVISAFHQRANFYSAMVYLSQSNFCLLVLVNFTLLLYSSFIYGLTQLCFGTLRAIEVEQLTERAWFAITETCLAMTIFREEIGAWFLVMFTALVTGKVWGWIGDGRVEILEQQPPPNPRLFHLRLSVSLAMSLLYDVWILRYAINTVIKQAKPNMMVMFLFEFAVLTTCSWRTGARYVLSLAEQNIIKAQTKQRLLERRQEVRQQREAMIRQREQAAAAGEEAPENQEPLPNPDDVDEMDIEVPGWAAKGEWVLWLDLLSDMIKLGIYVAFFLMLLMFYGLPIHIMRDLFMTTRDFLKRLTALLRYRRAILEMNKYPDATEQDLAQENTCIICREEMHHWDPTNNSGAIDRVRPKKLPCGHILHLGCLKSWLERQQVCPTCRSPVTADRARAHRAAGPRRFGALPQQAAFGQRAAGNGNDGDGDNVNAPRGEAGQNDAAQQHQAGGGQPRVFTFGPIRLGFGANGQQVRELAQQFGMPQLAGGNLGQVPATPTQNQPQQAASGDNLQQIGNLLQQAEQMVQREMQALQNTQQELQIVHLLASELQRLRQRRQQPHDAAHIGQVQPPISFNQPTTLPFPPQGQQFPMPTQAQAPQLTGYTSYTPPSFPVVPPRVNSPLMTRHGAPGHATSIPAGSPELPEGVVLPPGWSLMPLQRLDGTQNVPHYSLPPGNFPPQPGNLPQTGSFPQNGDSTGVSQPSTSSTQPTPTSSGSQGTHRVESSSLAAEAAAAAAAAVGESSRQRPTAVPRSPQTLESPPVVVSPSPVLPNWGGSAQLFGSGSRLDRPEATTQAGAHTVSVSQADGSGGDGNATQEPASSAAGAPAASRGESSSAQQQQQQQQHEQGETSQEREESSDKGKGRAATVEEAEDDEG